MHDSTHPSRSVLLKTVKRNRAKVKEVSVVFNYPKDPYEADSWRIYHPVYGGTMLDLGVYFRIYKLIS